MFLVAVLYSLEQIVKYTQDIQSDPPSNLTTISAMYVCKRALWKDLVSLSQNDQFDGTTDRQNYL